MENANKEKKNNELKKEGKKVNENHEQQSRQKLN